MARVPVEVVDISQSIHEIVSQTIQLANSLQGEFLFTSFSVEEEHKFYPYAFKNINTKKFFDIMLRTRREMRGYHPYIIAVVDSFVESPKFSNLFGNHRAKKGVALFTTYGIFDEIVPSDRAHCYILYYLARYSLSFVAPNHKNHDDTRDCAFDRKISKTDLLRSMKGRPFCDECRRTLVAKINSKQITALEVLFGATKTLLEKGYSVVETPRYTSVVIQTTQNGFGELQINTSNNRAEIIRAKQRRLNVLKIQQAQCGYQTPPHIINEIEDIEQEINQFQDESEG